MEAGWFLGDYLCVCATAFQMRYLNFEVFVEFRVTDKD